MRINGIELPDLHWIERFESFGVRAETKMTRGGKLWVWEGAQYGQNITLEGADNFGWFTWAQYQQIQALSSIPNTTYLLELQTMFTTVRFRNEDPPAVTGTWVQDFTAEPEASDLIGAVKIKLQVIS